MANNKKKNRSLSEDDIKTTRAQSRRSMLGLMAAGGAAGAAAAMGPRAASAQGTDADSGNITDQSGCGRGGGGSYTGLTDADNGGIVDSAGYGRGGRRC